MVNHPTTGGYGIPLRYTRRAALEATKLAEDAEIIVVSDSTRPMMTEAPTVFDALLFGQAHRFVDGRGVMLYPASDRVVYLVDLIRTDSQYSSLVNNLAGLPSVTKGSEIQMPDGRAFRTYLRVASDTFDVSSFLNPLAEGIPFANNVVFSGYQVDGTLQPGEYLKVWLGWWLHGPPSIDEDYHFTVQLQQVADTGLQVISQDDHVAFPSDYWRGGDMALSYFLVPIPLHLSPGAYTLNAGMYSYPDIVSVPIINSTGKSVGDSVQLTEYFYED